MSTERGCFSLHSRFCFDTRIERLIMAISEADVQASLRALIDPNTGRDFVSGKSVRKVRDRRQQCRRRPDARLSRARASTRSCANSCRSKLASLPGVGQGDGEHRPQDRVALRAARREADSRASRTSSPSRAARAASASRPPPSTWRWRSRRKAQASACSTPTSTARRSRPCSASPGGRNPRTARRWSRSRRTACRRCRSAS